MKPIFTLCLLIALGCCCQSIPQQNISDSLLLKNIVYAVQESHLKPKKIDNELSKEIYDSYLEAIDSKKEFLTQEDLLQLQQYEHQIDEELTNHTFVFLNEALKCLKKGIQKAEKYSQIAANNSLDFNSNEQWERDSNKLTAAANNRALKDRWHKKVKYMVLKELQVVEKQFPAVVFEEQKNRAIKRVKQLLKSKFQKINALTEDERLLQYANVFLKVHDAQTEYLSKAQKKKWQADFTRTLVGIGARIDIVDGYPQIIELVIGGPA